MSTFMQKLARKKYVDLSNVTNTKLARCLNTFDLTALGIGSTLGAGIYVVAGEVAKEKAGPSVCISFLIAAVASVLAGLCYAEFGARVPKTGSAYVYSYVTVGEFLAFVIGWNLILEYVIGTASVARAWSSYFDSLIDNKIQNTLKEYVHMDLTGFSKYPDFFALAITLLLTIILAVGVKESSRFNNLFTGVNLLVVTYVIICGLFKADIKNWEISPEKVHGFNATTIGSGGFMPFGFSGLMSGAATCFYAFVGFDCIATTGEEVKNPQKAIPISIVISLIIIFLAYFGISAVMTLMCPYYLLDSDAPLPFVFKRVGWPVARYFISVGAMCGLSTSLLGAMFPLPRVIYAMASDGILYRFLSRINDRFKTPLIATILSGTFAGLMAMMFDLAELVDMMSIGTLLAYTLVAVCVLLLRYRVKAVNADTVEIKNDERPEENGEADDETDIQKILDDPVDSEDFSNVRFRDYFRTMLTSQYKQPNAISEKVASNNVVLICILIVAISLVLIFAEKSLTEWWAIVIVIILAAGIAILSFSIWLQPENKEKVSFKVPLLPVLPILSAFVNIYLMLKLSGATWIRFGVWMFLGFVIYFTYGIWHSTGSQPDEFILLSENPSTYQSTQLISDSSEDNSAMPDPQEQRQVEISPLLSGH